MNSAPSCRHLHTDGRPCGSPALRGQPFCFHHHTARQPMPKRVDPTDPRILLTPQLPAPDDFPAIQRAVGEVLRLLANDRVPESRAAILLKGLAIASQNLARQHRREEKLAAQGLLPAPVTAFVNDPKHGTLAPEPDTESAAEPGCPTFATAPSSLRWAGEADDEPQPELQSQPRPEAPLPDPIPVLTPDPSPTTSYDEGKMIEINNYFQTIDDRRRERSEAWARDFEHRKSLELEALYDDRLREATRDLEDRLQTQLEARFQAEVKAEIPIPIQKNQYLTSERENVLALAS